MPCTRSFKPCLFVCLLLALTAIFAPNATPQTPAPDKSSSLSAIPLVFEMNQGQAPAEYQFLARRDGIQTYYFDGGIDIFVPQSKQTQSRLQLRWNGSGSQTLIRGEAPLPGHSNYFRGSDAEHWLRSVPQFGQVRYSHLYPGIDVLFHGTGEFLEHDFIVQPGADPSEIVFYANRPSRLLPSGDLEFDLGGSLVRLNQPVAYQEFAGSRVEVSVRYVLGKNGDIHFALGNYDRNHPLVIDPVFVFSTYLTGTTGSQITGVTTDSTGNVYVVGFTGSPDFPLTTTGNPLCTTCNVGHDSEAFISKLDPTGHTLLYSTFLGGSGSTLSAFIALDKNGNIIVSGLSTAPDFPHAGAVPALNAATNNSYYYLASLKPDGSALNFSGLIGGTGPATNGDLGKLTVDGNGNTYLAGTTDDPNFLLTAGSLDSTPPTPFINTLFVLKVDPTGALVYSTLVPGNLPANVAASYQNRFRPTGIHVDTSGQATVSGDGGLGLPTTPGRLASDHPTRLQQPRPSVRFATSTECHWVCADLCHLFARHGHQWGTRSRCERQLLSHRQYQPRRVSCQLQCLSEEHHSGHVM